MAMLLASALAMPLSSGGIGGNLVVVGNILGGTVLVVLMSWFVYLRPEASEIESEME
jgi:formate/nitrite transporter FocA (FNT family)